MEEIKLQWPGFTVSCDKCGSKEIVMEDSRGYSEMSGPWGKVSIICQGCGHNTEIVSD